MYIYIFGHGLLLQPDAPYVYITVGGARRSVRPPLGLTSPSPSTLQND